MKSPSNFQEEQEEEQEPPFPKTPHLPALGAQNILSGSLADGVRAPSQPGGRLSRAPSSSSSSCCTVLHLLPPPSPACRGAVVRSSRRSAAVTLRSAVGVPAREARRRRAAPHRTAPNRTEPHLADRPSPPESARHTTESSRLLLPVRLPPFPPVSVHTVPLCRSSCRWDSSLFPSVQSSEHLLFSI